MSQMQKNTLYKISEAIEEEIPISSLVEDFFDSEDLGLLSQNQIQVLQLRFGCNDKKVKKWKEVAALMGLHIQNVKNKYSKAKEILVSRKANQLFDGLTMEEQQRLELSAMNNLGTLSLDARSMIFSK